MAYGFGYKGSKSQIAEKIINFLPQANTLYDLFGGGGAITHCAALSSKYDRVIYNDSGDCAKLFEWAVDGIYRHTDPMRFITREMFFAEKDTNPFVKYEWSFGNNGKDYLYGKNIEQYKHCLHNAVVYAIDRAGFNQGINAQYDFEITDSGINSTLVAKGPSAVAYEIKKWIVRRLTPLECERLQGFPDRWTETPKIKSLSDNEYAFWLGVYERDKQIRGKKYKTPTQEQLIKWYNKLDCDGNRYKMLGNSVAIPCVFYILNNMAELQERKNQNEIEI